MILRGYIKAIGTPREWTSKKNGERRWTYPLVLSFEHTNRNGDTKEDLIVADHMTGNMDYAAKLEELRVNKTKCEMNIQFGTREYSGKVYQDTTLWDIQIMINKE